MDGRELEGGELIDCLRTSGNLCNSWAKAHAADYQGLDLLALVPRSVVGFSSRNIQL